MKTIIYKEDATKAIPSTTIDVFENCRNCKLLSREEVIEILESLPPAQPEIVRCKDCLYGLKGIPYRCRLAHDTDSENWYCADAKKKDGCCEGD